MNRPWVALNVAMSLDGKLTTAVREPVRFTSRADRRRMQVLRAKVDAVLIGAGTLRVDNPPLQISDPEIQRQRQAAGRPPGLVNVIVSRSLQLPPASRVFHAAAAPLVIVATCRSGGGGGEVATATHAASTAAPWSCSPSLAAAVGVRLPPRTELWRLGETEVDWLQLLARLRARGIHRLLVEGGSQIYTALLARDLVDEIFVTLAPTLLGGAGSPSWLLGPERPMAERRHLRCITVEREGDEIFCQYRLVPQA